MRSLFRSRTPEPAVVEPDPTIFPKIEGADIGAVFAGNRIAGDFYDSIRVSPERVLFGLLDVAGRRSDNRDLLRKAQEIFRTSGADLFSGDDINESESMTELSIRLNRGLIESSNGVHSCPAFIGCYHEKFGTLCYTNAGHTPGLLRDDSSVSELRPTGLPLGLFSHATLDAPTVALEKNAALLLVSRGVVECSARQASNSEFGLDRVKELLAADHGEAAQALCTSILNAADEFACKTPLSDDRTALALVRAV
jgi:serine phosphatase RsbU (regulator of sigma subunit)